jgi:uncharacterized membrane protein
MLNIHPAVVHFPIGLLTLYCILELLRFKKIQSKSYLFYVKAILLVAGTVGAFFALQTGELLEKEFTSALLEKHAMFANITTILFVVLSVAYLIRWFKIDGETWAFLKKPLIAKIWKVKVAASDFVLKSWVSVFLAAIAFVFLTFTGALGGAIAYGPDTDPIVSFVYHLFFKN